MKFHQLATLADGEFHTVLTETHIDQFNIRQAAEQLSGSSLY